MDAYNIYHILKRLWAEHTNISSGTITKSYDIMKVCVWTPDGYREVTNVIYNNDLKSIELILDQE
jgi:hypothetical protein